MLTCHLSTVFVINSSFFLLKNTTGPSLSWVNCKGLKGPSFTLCKPVVQIIFIFAAVPCSVSSDNQRLVLPNIFWRLWDQFYRKIHSDYVVQLSSQLSSIQRACSFQSRAVPCKPIDYSTIVACSTAWNCVKFNYLHFFKQSDAINETTSRCK